MVLTFFTLNIPYSSHIIETLYTLGCLVWPLMKNWICGLITILHIAFITLKGNNTIYCERLIMMRCTRCPHLRTAVRAVYFIFSALILFTNVCFRPSNQVVHELYFNVVFRWVDMEHKMLLWVRYGDFMCFILSTLFETKTYYYKLFLFFSGWVILPHIIMGNHSELPWNTHCKTSISAL